MEASPSNVDAYIIPDASGVDAGKCVRAGQRPMLPSFVTIKEAERIRLEREAAIAEYEKRVEAERLEREARIEA